MLKMMSGMIFAGAAFAVAAGDVTTGLSVKERPDGKTLFSANATVGNSRGNWRMNLYNKRAHGDKGRHLAFAVSNGQTFGFTALINVIKLTVNGIPWSKLQVKPKNVRKWAEGDREGIEFALNFDGAPVRVRASMTSGSPWLDFEVKPSAKGLTPVTNLLVSASAIPSFLDCGHGKSTRFDKYRRAVQTASRYLKPQKTGTVPLRPDDRWYALMDEDYDGSSEGRGMGPCAVRTDVPCTGRVHLNDGWVTTVEFTPDPAKPFRFSLLEYPERRQSNGVFVESLRQEIR